MADIAILSKNYEVHLVAASKKDGPVTFYSNRPWAKASAKLSQQGTMRIYFTAGGDSNLVEYEGTITQILLNPRAGAPETNDMLADCLDNGAKEDIEENTLKTLYRVEGLKKLTNPFSQIELFKAKDGKPVSEKYDRGYCIVNPMKQHNTGAI